MEKVFHQSLQGRGERAIGPAIDFRWPWQPKPPVPGFVYVQDGRIVGNVTAEAGSGAVAVVSENGCIEGDVHVPNLLLNGKVIGDVYASEKVELLKHAQVTGNVYYNLLEMAMGAEINGNLVHRKPEEQRLLEHRGDKKAGKVPPPVEAPSDTAAAKS